MEVSLLEEETGVPDENPPSASSTWQTLSHNVVSSTPRHERNKKQSNIETYSKSEIDPVDPFRYLTRLEYVTKGSISRLGYEII